MKGTSLCSDFINWNLPGLCSGNAKHVSGGCAGCPKAFPSLPDRLTSSYELTGIVLRVQVSLFHHYTFPVDIELLCHDHRHRSFYILSTLRVGRHDGDHAVAPDLQKSIEFGQLVISCQCFCSRGCIRAHPAKTYHQSSTCQCAGFQKRSSAY